jgi:beta-lactamase class A
MRWPTAAGWWPAAADAAVSRWSCTTRPAALGWLRHPRHQPRPRPCSPLALVFGREDRGLSNAELLQAGRLLCIDTGRQLWITQPGPGGGNRAAPVAAAQPPPPSQPTGQSTAKRASKRDRPVGPEPCARGPAWRRCSADAEDLLLDVGFLYPHTAEARMAKLQGPAATGPTGRCDEVALLRGMVRQLRWASQPASRGGRLLTRPLSFGSTSTPGALTTGRPSRPPQSSWWPAASPVASPDRDGGGPGGDHRHGTAPAGPPPVQPGQPSSCPAADHWGPSAGLKPSGSQNPGLKPGRFEPRSELTALSQQWQQLAAAQKDLQGHGLPAGAGRRPLSPSSMPDQSMPAASSIKTPILLVALDDLDQRQAALEPAPAAHQGAGGRWRRLDGQQTDRHPLSLLRGRHGDDPGERQQRHQPGDSATGGQGQAVNQRFQAKGLKATVLNNWLPDLDGTNTTSSRDLARSIALVDTGEHAQPATPATCFAKSWPPPSTDTLIPAWACCKRPRQGRQRSG